MSAKKVYRMEDGSEVHEYPSRASGQALTMRLRFHVESPAWVVHGDEGCQALVFAEELKRQWENRMESVKAMFKEAAP